MVMHFDVCPQTLKRWLISKRKISIDRHFINNRIEFAHEIDQIERIKYIVSCLCSFSVCSNSIQLLWMLNVLKIYNFYLFMSHWNGLNYLLLHRKRHCCAFGAMVTLHCCAITSRFGFVPKIHVYNNYGDIVEQANATKVTASYMTKGVMQFKLMWLFNVCVCVCMCLILSHFASFVDNCSVSSDQNRIQ